MFASKQNEDGGIYLMPVTTMGGFAMYFRDPKTKTHILLGAFDLQVEQVNGPQEKQAKA